MKFGFVKREDKWTQLRKDYERCKACMFDGPTEWCCKHHCGEYEECKNCTAQCRNTEKLCTKG